MANIKRLKDLVLVLKRVKKDGRKFDLSAWHYTDACGTAACACGWAAVSPRFRGTPIASRNRFTPYNNGSKIIKTPVINWADVHETFDIGFEDAHHLFSGFSYPLEDRENIDAVIERIREFIREEEEGNENRIGENS